MLYQLDYNVNIAARFTDAEYDFIRQAIAKGECSIEGVRLIQKLDEERNRYQSDTTFLHVIDREDVDRIILKSIEPYIVNNSFDTIDAQVVIDLFWDLGKAVKNAVKEMAQLNADAEKFDSSFTAGGE